MVFTNDFGHGLLNKVISLVKIKWAAINVKIRVYHMSNAVKLASYMRIIGSLANWLFGETGCFCERNFAYSS